MIAIIDSFAWIEFLGGTSLEPAVRRVLSDADVVVTPDIVLAEVARKMSRDGISGPTCARKLGDIATLSKVSPISIEIAVGIAGAEEALRANAKVRGLQKAGLADAVILSTARVLRGKVLTGDQHFYGLAETQWLAR